MSKHTPGPWSVDFDTDETWIEGPSYTVCGRIGNDDANLIAQTPALLQTLKNLICAAENNSGAEPSLSLYHYTVDQSKAAIKAAEGEQLNDAEQQLIDDLWG